MKRDIRGILLAGGESKRMGALKPLLLLNGITVLEILLDEYVNSQLSEVILVLGAAAGKIEEKLAGLRFKKLKIVVNTDYKKDMFSSIQKGFEIINNADAVLVGLIDNIFITKDIVNFLIREYKNREIRIPTFNGKNGHPIVLPFFLYKEILKEKPERTTLKNIINKHTDIVKIVKVWNGAVLFDMDNKEDYEKAKRLWKKRII